MAAGTPRDPASNRRLAALAGLVVALLAWNWADQQREAAAALAPQLKAAQATARRGAGDGDERRLEAQATRYASARRLLEQRLDTADSLEVAKAKVVYDLRRRCAAAVSQSCNVRLIDDGTRAAGTAPGTAAPTAAPATTPVAAAGARAAGTPPALEDLGIRRVRAVVSGSFQNEEFVKLSQVLTAETDAQWRINGFTVRSNSFELDVERHLRLPAAAGPALSAVPAAPAAPR